MGATEAEGPTAAAAAGLGAAGWAARAAGGWAAGAEGDWMAGAAGGWAAGAEGDWMAGAAGGWAAGAVGGWTAGAAGGWMAGATGGWTAGAADCAAAGAGAAPALGNLVHLRTPGPGALIMLFSPFFKSASDTGVLTVIERWPLDFVPPGTSDPSSRKPKPAAWIAAESILGYHVSGCK